MAQYFDKGFGHKAYRERLHEDRQGAHSVFLRDQQPPWNTPDCRIHCDKCEALMINGVFCHETGCPNSGKMWVDDRADWVLFVACRECGCEVEVGTICDCQGLDDVEDC